MIFYVVVLNDNVMGFIDNKEQQDFLLECDPSYIFLEFEWESGHNPPPMIQDIIVKDGIVELVN